MTDKITKHPSYGMVSFNRCTGSNINLYGSDIPHNTIISLEIASSECHRSLNRDSYLRNKDIIKVNISAVQFAELLTNMNTTGVPCTIKYLQGEYIEKPPMKKSTQTLFEEEIEESISEVKSEMRQAYKNLDDAINNNKGKKVMRENLETINRVIDQFDRNIAYTKSQFNKSMNKTVVEAKNEVESYVLNKTLQLGKEALNQQILSGSHGFNELQIVTNNEA